MRAAQSAERESDPDTVMAAFLDGLGSFGVEHVIYVTVDSDYTEPRTWANIDLYENFAPPKEDPFLHYCCDAYAPTLTGIAFMGDYSYLKESERDFIRAGAKRGFTAGIAIPVKLRGSRRFGGFNYGTGFDRETFEAKVLPVTDALYTTSLIIHRRLEELMTPDSAEPSEGFRSRRIAPDGSVEAMSLSEREREVLFLLSQGFARKEIAHLCTITPNTVGSYIKSIYRKLGVKNRAEATRKALDVGLRPPALGNGMHHDGSAK